MYVLFFKTADDSPLIIYCSPCELTECVKKIVFFNNIILYAIRVKDRDPFHFKTRYFAKKCARGNRYQNDLEQ